MMLTLYLLGLLAFWLIATWVCSEDDQMHPLVYVAIPLVSPLWPLLVVVMGGLMISERGYANNHARPVLTTWNN